MAKGEIDLERNLPTAGVEDLQSNSNFDMPEFFQSVKSSNYGGANNFIGYAFGANEEVPQRDLLNFPYSRA